MCSIDIFQGLLMYGKPIWSGCIDHTHQAINSGDIVEKTIFEREFLPNKSEELSADCEYILTVINKKAIANTSNVIDKNATVKTPKIVDDNVTEKCSKNCNDFYPNNNSLVCDLAQMYENRMHSDVTLQVGSEKFESHKCLLSARSPVFSAILEKDMVVNQMGVVTITDMIVSTLRLLLNFMYTNKVDELQPESALKLLLAAEKYQVLLLKKMCSAYLRNIICEKNVCDILNAADMIQDNSLKTAAMKYVQKYAHIVLNSESWKQLITRNASVVTETLGEVSSDLGMATNDD